MATTRGKGFGSAAPLAVPSPWTPSPCLRRHNSSGAIWHTYENKLDVWVKNKTEQEITISL